MIHQKCRICGERHPLGPCPQAQRAKFFGVDGKERLGKEVSPGVWIAPETLLNVPKAETPSAANQPKRKTPPRKPKGEVVATHPPTHQSKFAPIGECPYCDRQRALNAEAVRLHRQKKDNP